MANWGEYEIESLKLHYIEFNIPSDQIIKDKNVLEKFTTLLNAELKQNDDFAPKQVADQLLKLRKSGKLLRIRK